VTYPHAIHDLIQEAIRKQNEAVEALMPAAIASGIGLSVYSWVQTEVGVYRLSSEVRMDADVERGQIVYHLYGEPPPPG
jgi:hypothetical protein